MHAAHHHGVLAHGITLSRRQLESARQWITQAGLQDRGTVELRDYRDLQGEATYGKISSVGMFEHVGLRTLPVYFSTVKRLLKPAGLFLNHGITHDVEGWNKTLSTEFINRYFFSDGHLDLVSNIQRAMERTGFENRRRGVVASALRENDAALGARTRAAPRAGTAVRQRRELPRMAACTWPRVRWSSNREKSASTRYWRSNALTVSGHCR